MMTLTAVHQSAVSVVAVSSVLHRRRYLRQRPGVECLTTHQRRGQQALLDVLVHYLKESDLWTLFSNFRNSFCV